MISHSQSLARAKQRPSMMLYNLPDMSYSSGYVVGYLFSEDYERVVLVRKNRPKAAAGKLLGLGGKIEPGESHLSAMIREADEEAGVEADKWILLRTTMLDGDVPLHTFYGTTKYLAPQTWTDEEVIVLDLINNGPAMKPEDFAFDAESVIAEIIEISSRKRA